MTFLWWCALAAGVAMLVAGAEEIGPDIAGRAGAVTVATTYAWALAVRTGGRPIVFALLALTAGLVVIALDRDDFRTGAAVMTAALAAVLAVMVTVPARRFITGIREAIIATITAGIGAFAAIGFEPVASFARFEYAVLGLALVAGFYLVYRLGAGLHGLGRRGLLVVVGGCGVLGAMLLYAEMVRQYGTPGLVDGTLSVMEWMRDNLNGYLRPMQALLGIPALVWGTHMRSRRRQGWWICAFGLAFTAPVASTLVDPGLTLDTALASVGYSLIVGVLIGFVLIWIDMKVTGSTVPAAPRNGRGSRAAGRRAVRDDDSSAVRVEPPRSQPLL